jgi:hypothetical protein
MIEFHPRTQIVKSTHTVFSIPPKRKANTHTPAAKAGSRPSKVQQAANALETPQERAARMAAKVTAFRPGSAASFPSTTPEAIAAAVVKTAKLRGKPL